MAIAGGGRLFRTRHEPRVDRRVKRDRHPVANPAGSPAIATPSPDAGEKMGARLDGQLQACQVAPHCSAGFLHAGFCLHELGKTAQAKKLLMKGPATLLREPIYYYNMGCYDALLGNAKSAQVHLLTSFKMDPSFRDIAKKDPDLKAIQELI
jgi:hypothetical protein